MVFVTGVIGAAGVAVGVACATAPIGGMSEIVLTGTAVSGGVASGVARAR